ncbi:stabilizer of axonemal microtubules 1-like [Vespa velutina]|uniref:stabilizer of axonemal microtubules 1-like n=1 Tax=Vespa velutina TaxID=202808 RepID=UPI001FB2FBD8|nr:stabilizer of axonemal microtubules 1-like [Vespa velutina]
MEICPPDPVKERRPVSIIEAKNKIRLDHDECCNCCCCCIPQPTAFEYVQPEVPKSFRPIRYYWKPDVPMEDNTTYRYSYWDGPRPLVEPIKPKDLLTVGDGCITDETTHKLSYLGNWCVKTEPSITPCDKQWLGRGPMQDETTQKHDYTWKSIIPPESIKGRNSLYLPCASLSDDTTYRLSYFPSACYLPTKSYAPKRDYCKPEVPMDGCTTYRLSYWSNEPPTKEDQPWRKKREYHQPVNTMENCTTYKLSYWPHCEKPRPPFIIQDTENILNADCCFNDNTTYQLSYFNCGGEKSDPIKLPENICVSSCPLSHDTIHRLSFLGNWCVTPEKSITPCDRQLLGRGPMQDETTQKHDYTWRQCIPPSEIRPEDNLMCAPIPLECCTTHKLSYIPNNHTALLRNNSYAPHSLYQRSNLPMESETTMRLSYQPVEPVVPVSKPWSKMPLYHSAITPIDDNTTYNLRYLLIIIL